MIYRKRNESRVTFSVTQKFVLLLLDRNLKNPNIKKLLRHVEDNPINYKRNKFYEEKKLKEKIIEPSRDNS